MCVLFKLLSNISHTSCLNCLRFLNRIYIVCTLCVKLMKLSLQRWLYPCKIVLYCILFLVIRTDHFFVCILFNVLPCWKFVENHLCISKTYNNGYEMYLLFPSDDNKPLRFHCFWSLSPKQFKVNTSSIHVPVFYYLTPRVFLMYLW